jgi:hypothetical protein
MGTTSKLHWHKGARAKVRFNEMHRYLAVHCRTELCRGRMLLKYLGAQQMLSSSDFQFPMTPLLLRCEECHRFHEYWPSYVQPLELSEPPAPGFQDLI